LCLHDRFICTRCTTIRSGRNRYICILSSCACKSRCAPHCRRHFRYDGVSTPFISRAILLHEKKQARTSPPASKPAAYSSIARFQPRTLNKQGIDRASVHQLAIRLRSNNRSKIVQKKCRQNCRVNCENLFAKYCVFEISDFRYAIREYCRKYCYALYLNILNNSILRTIVVGNSTSLVWFRALPCSVD